MALLPIIIAPDPRLKLIAAPVGRVDDEVRQLMDDMLETMYLAPGVGLAAPQVSVLKRVIVVDASAKDAEAAPLRMANPELIEVSDEDASYEEGCLSLPEHYATVARPARVRVRYLDYENEIREIDAEGLLGTCVQHEMDHLDGILFVDHISALKRNMILRKLTKFKKAEAKKAEETPAGASAAAE
jgi:peptide deformylase